MPISQEDCSCEKQCPGDACICMWDYDNGRCVVDCPDVIVFHLDRFLAQDSRIGLNVRNVTRARLGEFLDRLSIDEVLIPASAASDTVAMSMYDTSLGDALREARLVVRERDHSTRPWRTSEARSSPCPASARAASAGLVEALAASWQSC